jgi:hypothetical protein
MKQHAVPENIMDVEFKLFGSLTAKQFGYIVAGGGVGLFFYYLFKSLNTTFLGWIFAGLSVLLGLSLALIRINDQPFEVWLGNFLSAMFSSQKRVWKKRKKIPQSLSNEPISSSGITTSTIQPKQPIQTAPPTQTIQKQSISEPVSGGPAIPQHPFKNLAEGQPDNDKQKDERLKKEEKVPEMSPIAGQAVQGETAYIPGSSQKYMKVSTNQTPNRPINVPPSRDSGAQDGKFPTLLDNGEAKTTEDSKMPQVKKDESPAEGSKMSTSRPMVSQASPSVPKAPHVNKADLYSDVIPDKPSEPTTSLPKTMSSPPILEGDTGGKGGQALEEENKALRQKVADFTDQKTKLERGLSSSEQTRQELKEQNAEITQQLENLRREVESIKQERKRKVPLEQPSSAPGQKVPVSDDQQILSPKVYDGPSLTKKPNVVSGIVKTKEGKLLPGVVVIIKNEQGRPVRAMKTNTLGQFITTTALEEGLYAIELSKNEYSFGSYEIKLTGNVLPTYEFIAG